VSLRTETYNREGRQGYPNRIETNPWNLIRLKPAEGVRRSSYDPAGPDATEGPFTQSSRVP